MNVPDFYPLNELSQIQEEIFHLPMVKAKQDGDNWVVYVEIGGESIISIDIPIETERRWTYYEAFMDRYEQLDIQQLVTAAQNKEDQITLDIEKAREAYEQRKQDFIQNWEGIYYD